MLRETIWEATGIVNDPADIALARRTRSRRRKGRRWLVAIASVPPAFPLSQGGGQPDGGAVEMIPLANTEEDVRLHRQ